MCMPRAADRAGEYATEAVARGAAAVVLVGVETEVEGVAVLRLPDMAQLGCLLRRWYGTERTSTLLTGITGTDGKTSVCWMLRQALSRMGRDSWGCGTLGVVRDAGQIESLANTTPSLLRLHALLAEAQAAGVTDLVMEVSSHGIAQQRIAGLDFAAAIWTTLGHDHLQDHGGFDAYARTKAGFIRTQQALGRPVIANADDAQMAHYLSDPVLRYGHGLYRTSLAMAWEQELPGFVRLNDGKREIVVEDIPLGEFHAENIACVATYLRYVRGVEMQALPELLSGLTAPPGRLEPLPTLGDWQVFVDYAHTPEAMARCLKVARELTRGRLLLVFGCGGERDRAKRPELGRVAVELANLVWITSDNPRGEAPEVIASEIEAGMPRPYAAEVHLQLDRERAIAEAVAELRAGDTLVIAGKGHENYMEVGGVRLPWSDRAIAARYLERKGYAQCA
ncbi:MAG: UDP-N-acetylmuramoyl-L-alanyl-D-glutamate--2,6-diaminopimelate ligase [Zetaproteobacteria bacterium]|nr:MAG: UDP-N-acetylmuramoyl-L-alanyl-D-glutamate--2,6-diaminopimelate ligase [Zetaproteobacteria bacterium]